MQAFPAASASTILLVTQCFHRIETRREIRGDQGGERADQESANADDSHIVRNDFGRNRRELIDLAGENLDVQSRSQPATELVSVTDQHHPKSQASNRSKKAYNCSLTKKHPDDLRNVRSKRLHNPDLMPLLHGYRDERAHNSKSRDNHDKEQKEKHHCPL